MFVSEKVWIINDDSRNWVAPRSFRPFRMTGFFYLPERILGNLQIGPDEIPFVEGQFTVTYMKSEV